MKNTRVILSLAAFAAAGSFVIAADAGRSRTEKHVVITSAGPAEKPEKPREPVTFLGLEVGPVPAVLAAQIRLPEGQGLVVNVVVPNSPAAKAGLQQHDVLTRLDDQILIDPRQLSVLVRSHKEGDTVTLTYMRAGAEARATATLEKHVPPAMAFHFIGEGEPGAFFEERDLDGLPEDVLRDQRFERRVIAPHGLPMPGVPSTGTISVPGAPRVMIYRPSAKVVFADDAGSLEVRMNEGRQALTAKDARGAVIFTGPVGTSEERAALPEDLRKRLEKLESMGVFDPFEATTPPPTPTAPVAPMAPGVSAGGVTEFEYAPEAETPAIDARLEAARTMVL